MPKLVSRILISVALILANQLAYANLHDRGAGLVYDDELNVTWLQSAGISGRSMTFAEAIDWVESYTHFDPIRGKTWSEWRLPRALPLNNLKYVLPCSGLECFRGRIDNAYNITSKNSELAYMFYVNLANVAPKDEYGIDNVDFTPNWKTGPFGFSGRSVSKFWTSGTLQNPSYPEQQLAIILDYSEGWQTYSDLGSSYWVWAVMDGDVSPVPEPSALMYSVAGLMFLLMAKAKRTP